MSSNRQWHICSPSQTGTIILSPDFPNSVDVAQQVVWYEEGTKVLTGYVIKSTRTRPSYEWAVEVQDTYTRVMNTFLYDRLTVGFDANDQPIKGYSPQPVSYWIGYICGLAGISYSIDSDASYLVPIGTQIGLRSAHDSLMDVQAYNTLISYVAADGTLHFTRLSRGNPSKTITSAVMVSSETSDEWSRNLIKVFGYATDKSRVYSEASASIVGIPDGSRASVISNPMIYTQPEADRISSYLIGELGHLSRVYYATIPGDPTYRVGQTVKISAGDVSATDVVTSIESRYHHEQGYTTVVTLGEKCPRIGGWSYLIPPVYAGTTNYGVYKSVDNGGSWSEYNTGIPAGKRYVKRLAFNSDGTGMAVVDGSLYWTDGNGSWSSRSLPAPINSAGDSPPLGYGAIVAVSATGAGFDVLTTNYNTSGSNVQNARSWVYESTGSGTDWTSTELYDGSSGSGYHLVGYDISSELGSPTILASSGSVYTGTAIVLKGDYSRMGVLTDLTTGGRSCGDFANRGLTDYYITGSRVEGTAPDRHLYIDFNFVWDDADLEYINFYYKIFGSDLYDLDTGPYNVSGPFGTPIELSAPVQPPWPFSTTFHAAELDIAENSLPGLGISGPFVIGFMTLAGSRVDVDHRWIIVNGEPRSCAQWILENPDAGGVTRYHINSGFITYEFT